MVDFPDASAFLEFLLVVRQLPLTTCPRAGASGLAPASRRAQAHEPAPEIVADKSGRSGRESQSPSARGDFGKTQAASRRHLSGVSPPLQ